MLVQSCAADQAHLRSHSGPGSADVFLGCPSGFEFQLQLVVFRTLALERLRLPLQLSEAACVCGARLDTRAEGTGRHVHDQVFCGSERPHSPPRGHSQGSVVKPVQQCVAKSD